MSSEDRTKLEDSFRQMELEQEMKTIQRQVSESTPVPPPTDVERRRAAMEKARPKNWGNAELVTAQNIAAAQSLGAR